MGKYEVGHYVKACKQEYTDLQKRQKRILFGSFSPCTVRKHGQKRRSCYFNSLFQGANHITQGQQTVTFCPVLMSNTLFLSHNSVLCCADKQQEINKAAMYCYKCKQPKPFTFLPRPRATDGAWRITLFQQWAKWVIVMNEDGLRGVKERGVNTSDRYPPLLVKIFVWHYTKSTNKFRLNLYSLSNLLFGKALNISPQSLTSTVCMTIAQNMKTVTIRKLQWKQPHLSQNIQPPLQSKVDNLLTHTYCSDAHN